MIRTSDILAYFSIPFEDSPELQMGHTIQAHFPERDSTIRNLSRSFSAQWFTLSAHMPLAFSCLLRLFSQPSSAPSVRRRSCVDRMDTRMRPTKSLLMLIPKSTSSIGEERLLRRFPLATFPTGISTGPTSVCIFDNKLCNVTEFFMLSLTEPTDIVPNILTRKC